ncbi:T9SS type B sorting domain-containing protein [Spirosoma sp. KNUC1025]|uniref:T9SS type B sorting domain-containing protein n=1 Tax=Spirosoma sp. KNUC1025 TaxID=2894082 RepID=UPI0038643ECE|nr:gliding motility-associated C-terminal domain-containing protein [Spirosoma sp. KNUC1025]
MMNLLPVVCFLRLWLTDCRGKTNVRVRWQLIGLLFFFAQALPLFAQDVDPNNNYCTNPQGAATGGFTLDRIRICPGDRIRVTAVNPPNLVDISYVPDYKGDGIPSNRQLQSVFTYPTPGTYTILQVAQLNGNRAIKCQTITVLPLEPVQFTAKSCTGREVTLQVNSATLGQYDTYVVNWGDGTLPVEMSRAELEANPQHSYAATSPNAVTVSVDGVYGSLNASLCNSSNPQTVALASEISQPIIQALTAADNGTITLQYQVGAASPVQLYQKVNGTYVNTGQRATGPGTFQIKTDATQVQCFKVVSQDVCGSTTLDSDEVCSLVLDARATNKKNTLNWQPYAGADSLFKQYQITRNDSPVGSAITTKTSTTYTDSSVTCGTQYCYRLVATLASKSTQTIVTSAPSCVTGISGTVPDNLGNIVVSVANNHPNLTVNLPTAGTPASYTLLVSRAEGSSGTYSPLTSLASQNTYVDASADAASGSYCYKVEYQGGCGLGLPASQPACSIHLSSSSIRSMDWNADSPFSPGSVADYAIELVDSVSNREKSVGITTHYDRSPTEVVYIYRVVAKSGTYTSYSNYVVFEREDQFTVPGAFTPNGDNMNDEFLPKGLYAERFQMHIYNRWGEVLYSTADKTKGWDGLINGQPANVGQYMYRIEVIDISNQTIVRTGSLLLIR